MLATAFYGPLYNQGLYLSLFACAAALAFLMWLGRLGPKQDDPRDELWRQRRNGPKT